jgi:hypothetical protein
MLSVYSYSIPSYYSKPIIPSPFDLRSFPSYSIMSSSINYTILFHGNCIDGWFSAYIAHSVLKNTGNVNMYPISPSQTNTWPKNTEMKGTHILLLDVSVAESYRVTWIKSGALSVNTIDHHASAVDYWPDGDSPIDTTACAALQTWKHFYPGVEIPFWLHHIDRIDRWDNPTYEDRCVREVLNEIAHKPVQKKQSEAFALTEIFLMNMNTPIGIMIVTSQGKQILDQKDATLLNILTKGGIHNFTQEYITGWNLPQTWFGANVYIIDNTNITLDTTEAAHIVFQHYPHVNVFINYRKKVLYGRGPGAIEKTMYTYSARSRDFNLTDGTILKGHPTSAGATLIKGEVPILPFLLSPN